MLDLLKKAWPWALSHVVVGAVCAVLGLSRHPAPPPPPATTKAVEQAKVSDERKVENKGPVETKTRTVYYPQPFQTEKNCTISYDSPYDHPVKVVETDVIRGPVQTTTEKASAVARDERDTSTPTRAPDRPRLSLALFPAALEWSRTPYLVMPTAEVGVRVVGNFWVEGLYVPGAKAYLGARVDF